MYGTTARPLHVPIGLGSRKSYRTPPRLYAPLPDLLASGGDDRLAVAPGELLNIYGCTSSPAPAIDEFASSTATTISSEAYQRASEARLQLAMDAEARPIADIFDERLESLRDELRDVLRLAPGVEIVFAPSGTDANLLAAFLARHLAGGTFRNLVTLAGESGSGVTLAASGRHFSGSTSLGESVAKGAVVDGFAARNLETIVERDDIASAMSILRADEIVIDAVRVAVEAGERVLLHAMDSSKTGLRAPTLACLDHIALRWPGHVQVLVDACQMRLSRDRLNAYLRRNFLVTITGSKFFTGPAFSGALLVPAALAGNLRRAMRIPNGLRDYSVESSWPSDWRGIRRNLTGEINFGQWLRWEAALEEMQRFFRVPADFRALALQTFASAIPQILGSVGTLRAVASPYRDLRFESEGMTQRTIFPFLVCRDGKPLPMETTVALYRRLNERIAESVATERAGDAASPCFHLGQPVGIDCGTGVKAGALRVSASARLVVQAWDPADTDEQSIRRLHHGIDAIANALDETAFLASRID